MFKDYISREHGTPWGETGMTTARWKEIRPSMVEMSSLIATQNGVYIKQLLELPIESFSGDLLPHVVLWRGDRYLEDGHHRVVRDMLQGRKFVRARLLNLDSQGD